MLGNYTNRWGRDPIVLLGMLTHFISFLLIFYNLPDGAIHGYVDHAYGQLFHPSRLVYIVYYFISCFYSTWCYKQVAKPYSLTSYSWKGFSCPFHLYFCVNFTTHIK